jgi:PAS domain S-box-containing protein
MSAPRLDVPETVAVCRLAVVTYRFAQTESVEEQSAAMRLPASLLEDVFPGDSAMSAAMRAHDWAATALGDPAHWPEGLKVPLRMMLTSRFEMWLGWGDDLAFFYNDAYAPTLGTKHPAALGQPVRKVWAEIYDQVEGRFTSVMRDGIATWDKALMLLLERGPYPEETYHTFSYSPLRGDSRRVEGLMCVVTEETQRVIGERRIHSLHELATGLLPARTRAAVLAGADAALRTAQRDFPFAQIRLFDGSAADGAGIGQVDWPLDRIRDGAAFGCMTLVGLFDDPPRGPWDIPPREALVVAIAKAGHEAPSGALVLGLNPFGHKDADTLGFAQLLAGQIAGALAVVDAASAEVAETERLRELFAQAPSFMAILRGPEHRIELHNAAYAQLVDHRDVIGRTVREAMPEIAGQGFIDLLDRVYATGERFVGQSARLALRRDVAAAAAPRIVDFVYQPIRNADGAVSGIFVEGIDVTAAHDAVAALRDSEAQFRTLAQAMPNQVWTATPDGELDWFNDQTYAYAGLDRAALAGQGWARIVHPDDVARAGAAWMDALAAAETYEIEFRIRRADGAYRWHLVRALPIRDSEGGVIRWIGTNTDIDDRKREEAESARERERIWASTNDLMATVGLDGFLKSANPAWTRLLGRDMAELLASPVKDFIDPADHDRLPEVAGRIMRGEPVLEFEHRLIHKDGARSVIAWSAEPAGDVIHLVGRNVTEQRAAEEALRQSQKMEAVGQLTGGIAHDFNNLLQGITGSLDLVQKRVSQGRFGELEPFVEGAMASAKRAAALTHRLLAFSRRQPLDPAPVHANPLIASMEDLLRRTLGEGIRLELALAPGLWLTLCDPNQLESAVLNLAINARDAMPAGGTLTIETANADLDTLYAARLREVKPGQYVCISVTDTGTGMSAEVVAKAFEPFFTTKPIGQGTGLGLSMIYGFARQSEGSARIYSEPGYGTTFRLYLPRHFGADEVAAGSPAVTDAHGAARGETVLVVEDEAVVRALILDVLSDLGYRALEAADGPAALAILQSHQAIDLLLTDVGLPGLNGRQVADAARVLRPGLKILFMTGYAENAARASGFLEPGMAMIIKPFAMEALATRIRDILAVPVGSGVGGGRGD